jgi:hypothetical protein
MDILNVTYRGLSADYALDSPHPTPLSDADVRRIAIEVIRAGELRLGIEPGSIRTEDLDDHVVERFQTPSGERRIYLRPKVPFG